MTKREKALQNLIDSNYEIRGFWTSTFVQVSNMLVEMLNDGKISEAERMSAQKYNHDKFYN